MSVNPKQPQLRSGGYNDETSIFTDINALLKNFQTKRMRASLTSPPLAHQVDEMTLVVDKTALRIYCKIDNVLRYIQLT